MASRETNSSATTPAGSSKKIAFAALHSRDFRAYFVATMLAMASMGLKAFSGLTVGVMGGLIGVHWSLAASAMVLLTVTVALFAFALPGQLREEFI